MTQPPNEHNIARAAAAIRDARRIAVLTGAGASAESGVPTFRDAMTGLWSKYDPHQLATPEAFARDPALVTRWYDWRRCLVAACRPNAGHFALAALQRWAAGGGRAFTLLTQNVDGLHQAAGSTGVVELHGSIRTWRCTKTGEEVVPGPEPMTEFPVRTRAGGLLRPGVVWFGEALPEAALEAAARAAAECDVFLSIGTSAVVYPAAGLVHAATAAGATAIEINRDPTPISREVDVSIQGLSGEALPAIAAALGVRMDETTQN